MSVRYRGYLCFFIPSNFRTTAKNDRDDAYIYWSGGGFSWAIAYASGLSALAYQVNPKINYDEILELLVDTKTVNKNGTSIINPKKFIEAVKSKL